MFTRWRALARSAWPSWYHFVEAFAASVPGSGVDAWAGASLGVGARAGASSSPRSSTSSPAQISASVICSGSRISSTGHRLMSQMSRIFRCVELGSWVIRSPWPSPFSPQAGHRKRPE
jgi:hypothetical protein